MPIIWYFGANLLEFAYTDEPT